MIRSSQLVALAAVLIGVGCQDNISTPFPPGLEPIEDDPVPVQQGGARTEMLVTQAMDDNAGVRHAYGRGYVLAPPGQVWLAVKAPEVMFARCSTDARTVTPNDEPDYEFSFLVHYVVHNVLTIEWDDQWRFGTVEGTPEAPTLAMIKHQKIAGSDFITLSEGTVQLNATDDPAVTELAFVEILDAAGGSDADVVKGLQVNYDAMVAVAHGNPIPPCP